MRHPHNSGRGRAARSGGSYRISLLVLFLGYLALHVRHPLGRDIDRYGVGAAAHGPDVTAPPAVPADPHKLIGRYRAGETRHQSITPVPIWFEL